MGRILTPRGTGDTVTADFNEINLTDSQDQKKAKLEQWLAKGIGTRLLNTYPNRQWKVVVDIPGQMVIVGCDSISNTKGYHISMIGRSRHDLEDKAIFAAAEILERHNLARTKHFNADQIETLARDAQDNVITPDSAPEPI